MPLLLMETVVGGVGVIVGDGKSWCRCLVPCFALRFVCSLLCVGEQVCGPPSARSVSFLGDVAGTSVRLRRER